MDHHMESDPMVDDDQETIFELADNLDIFDDTKTLGFCEPSADTLHQLYYPTLKRAFRRSHREQLSKNYAKTLIKKAQETKGKGGYPIPAVVKRSINPKSKRIQKIPMVQRKVMTLKLGGQLSVLCIYGRVKKERHLDQ